MGDFRIVIEACGGHGCDRHVKDGGSVFGCRHMNCPDCMVRELVEAMQRKGMSLHKAEIVHWPADFIHPSMPPGSVSSYKKETEVRDNLLTKKRSGSF